MAPSAAPKKRKTESAPPIDKLLLPAIGIGLALLGYQFFKGIKAEIPRVNLLDEVELRQVFFGEGEGAADKSYCVLCHDESSSLPLSSVFLDAYTEKKSPAEFRVVDCNFVLPSSEKTIAERFKLDLKKRPTIFVSGKVGEPKQIPTKHLKTGKMLTKVLRNLLERRAAKIETTQELRTKCLDKDICGLLLKGSKVAPNYVKSAMNKLLEEFPSVSFGFVDSTVEYVLNVEEYLPELQDEQPRFVVFRKVSGGTGGDSKERLKTSLAALPTNGVAYGPMSNLVASVVQQTAVMTKVPVLPVIKTRTKKLEQEERNKRARKLEQQRRQAEGRSGGGSGSSTGGAFETNDGSRDGRRAERERRRAEHMAQHNVREKTPEEIAELERQRRIRMDEEAARWNIAPEDAPDEGEPVGDEFNLDDIMGDDEDGGERKPTSTKRDQHHSGDDDDEDNGDDVLDLD